MKLGIVAIVLWAAHAVELIARGEPDSLLWICNVASLLVAAGCLVGRSLWVAVPTLWLFCGTPLWLLDVFSGGDLLVTSFGSHLGVLAIGVVIARRLGWPRGAWWKAAAAQPLILVPSRLLTPPEHNVNLAFSIWKGSEGLFPSHGVYLGTILGGTTIAYLLLEKALLWRRPCAG